MPIPVTEKDKIHKQFVHAVGAWREQLFSQHPTLMAEIAGRARDDVLKRVGAEDYSRKMQKLCDAHDAIEAQIAQLNLDTARCITGATADNTTAVNRFSSRLHAGALDPFVDYPSEAVSLLNMLWNARKRELLRETAAGRRLAALDAAVVDFTANLTLCCNHKQMTAVWRTALAAIGGMLDDRKFPRINIGGSDGQQATT